MEDLHEWVSFKDDDDVVWMLDATFLTSNWNCIYGAGCLGVLDNPTPELEQGCCSHGAHFSDDEDHDRVMSFVPRLTAEDWQHIEITELTHVDSDGDRLTTTVEGGGCVFLNNPDFAGGAGCALHRAALRHGERPLDWKPEVCWQLPLRLDSYEDDNGITTMFLREWKRADWGTGGDEFHWWCTEDDLAFVDREPVYVTLKDEVSELVGDDVYEAFRQHVESKGTATFLPHPTTRADEAR